MRVAGQDSWAAIAYLCQSTYWSRTWIVQETMLARRLPLRLSSGELSWESFIHWCDLITTLLRESDAELDAEVAGILVMFKALL
jgi:hypothetical protein